MRNLKRALSLALASVMLLGMMVVGTSAAFTDFDQIVNTEAVEITAGLGLFAGNPDGSFNPKGTVTRAQMATVITKMLYGSKVDADAYKGTGKFSDVANFEGGWAEGYINMCVGNNVVSGYPDGTFKPGQAVTTAEAAVMIIKALKVAVPAGEWPTNVMVKADEMKLFEELAVKPGANVALTRDQLASIVWEGLNYSAEGKSGYTVPGVTFIFDDYSDALNAALSMSVPVTEITEVSGDDTLASTVFELQTAKGFVTENQATGYDYTEVAGVAVDLKTGLDKIGHYVTVYYAEEYESEDEPGVAYCIVDEAKYVKVNADEAVDTKKEYQSFFGTKRIPAAASINTVSGTYATTTESSIAGYDVSGDNWVAANGTYVIYEGEVIGFIAGATKTLSKVTRVTTTAGKESINVNGYTTMKNNADEDVVNEYEGIAKDDIVVVEEANGIYTLTKAEKVEGKITRYNSSSAEADEMFITVNGTKYERFVATDKGTSLKNDPNATGAVNFETTYEIYVVDGKYVGWTGVATSADVSDIVYVVDDYAIEGAANAYGKASTNYYVQAVDMNGKEVSILVGIDYDATAMTDLGVIASGDLDDIRGFYTFELSTDKDAKKAEIMVGTPAVTSIDEGVYASSISDEDFDSKTSYVEADGDIAFVESTTKFIIVDHTTAGSELDIAIVTGSYKKDNVSAPVLLSKDADGNLTLEVVVINASVTILAEDYIYVTADQKANSSTVGAGQYEYTVYFTDAAENKAIIVDEAITSTGFYTYSTEVEDGVTIYSLDEAEATDCIVEGAVFNRLNGTKLIAGSSIVALEAASAKIVDAREAETIEESDVPEIIALEDLTAAKDAGYSVTFTAMLDEELETVTHIFITAVEEIVEA